MSEGNKLPPEAKPVAPFTPARNGLLELVLEQPGWERIVWWRAK